MQVTKIRASANDGLVPAGRYFSVLADNLRAANARAAAVTDAAEARERKLEARFRRRATSVGRGAYEHQAAM